MMIISHKNRGKGCHMQEISKRKKEIAKKYQHKKKKGKKYKWKTKKLKRKKMHRRPMIDFPILIRILNEFFYATKM